MEPPINARMFAREEPHLDVVKVIVERLGCSHGGDGHGSGGPSRPERIENVARFGGRQRLDGRQQGVEAAEFVLHNGAVAPEPRDEEYEEVLTGGLWQPEQPSRQLVCPFARRRHPGSFYAQPSSSRRSSSMPKWWATSWITVSRTTLTTCSSVRHMAQMGMR
jgi:hypothetical protein